MSRRGTFKRQRTQPNAVVDSPAPSSTSSRNGTGRKRVLDEVSEDEPTDTTQGAQPTKRPRVPEEEVEQEQEETLNLLALPDLVLFELCQWLDWDPALALARTSRTARNIVLANHPVARVVLLELVPLVASAVASVSLLPQAALAHCDDYIDRRDLRAALALPAEPEPDLEDENTPPGGLPRVEDSELGLGTKAEVLLDALTQQVSARKQQLHIERLDWESLYTNNRVCSAIKRVVHENIVVRSYARREVTSDEAMACILEVKIPNTGGGHDVFILNILYWVLGMPTNDGRRKDHIFRTQAYCRRAGDTTTKPALLFGYHEELRGKRRYGAGCHHKLDRGVLTHFAQALGLPLDAQQMAAFFAVCGTSRAPPNLADTGHYREDLHLFSEQPLLAPPPSIHLDLNHRSCSLAFLARLAQWISTWRYKLKLPRAYIVAALKKPETVATIHDVERVLPHILRGIGECSRMQIIEASVDCWAKVHLAVPGEEGHLELVAQLSSQEGEFKDQSQVTLSAKASTDSLSKRFDLGTDEDPCALSLICLGRAKGGADIIWQSKFLREVARTYGLISEEACQSDTTSRPSARRRPSASAKNSKADRDRARSELIRIAAILNVCFLAATPQYDVIKEGAATLVLGVDGPSVPFGFRMLPFGRSLLSVPVEESVAHGLHSRYTAVVEGMAKTWKVLAMPYDPDDEEDEEDEDDEFYSEEE